MGPLVLSQIEIEQIARLQGGVQYGRTVTTSVTDGEITLNQFSTYVQFVNGSASGFGVRLPDATTLIPGHTFMMFNNTDNVIQILTCGGEQLVRVNIGSRIIISLKLQTPNPCGTWDWMITSKSSFQGTAPVLASYGALANAGRYLNIYPNLDSFDRPFRVPISQTIIAVVLDSTSLTTGAIDIVDTDTSVVYYSMTFTNQLTKTVKDLSVVIPAERRVSVVVSAGSFLKPGMAIYLSSN